ncbi:hypothetical protein C2G38_2033957 [Gigaspora rosea]|uniref:B30.2/SPRY domain-containing protein n=1 Tax=Gigaspora rosea TaxID=44941 RepID=A0A397VHM9_9GLOM|nr:hypothetical protein C2G38_2033957 [Gigaspora rosea]
MNYPIYPKCGIFYFEIRINKGTNGLIGIGFCTKTIDTNSMPGWDNESWGYHNDGNFYYDSGKSNPYGPSFTKDDTIGCCLNFKRKTVFYTKNSVNLGIAFRDLEEVIYPCIGLQSQNSSVEVIFSRKKFKYTAITDDDIVNELLRKKWLEALDLPNDEAINQQQYNLLDSIFEPNNVHLLEYQGKINFILGRYEDALLYLTNLLKIEPANAFALSYRGKTYQMMEKYKESLVNLYSLLKIENNDICALKIRNEIKEVIRERKLKLEERDLRVLGLRIQLEEMLMEQEGLAELSGAHLKEIWERKKQEEIDEVQKKIQSLENDLKEKIKSFLEVGQQEQSIPKVPKQKEYNSEELNLEKLIQLLPEREYIQQDLDILKSLHSHLLMLKDDLELIKSGHKKPREDDLLKILKFPEFLDLNRLEQEL